MNLPSVPRVFRRPFGRGRAKERTGAARHARVLSPQKFPQPERERTVEHSSVFGTLWAGLGLGAFYLALTWVNLLLGHFLTPLFLIPMTWLQDAVNAKKG